LFSRKTLANIYHLPQRNFWGGGFFFLFNFIDFCPYYPLRIEKRLFLRKPPLHLLPEQLDRFFVLLGVFTLFSVFSEK
jgi:hypothetical protein